MTVLGQKIKDLREIKSWSQSKLAMLSGLDRNYIKSIENGASRHPRPDRLMKIAAALGIGYEDLFVAAGYDTGTARITEREETPEELLARLRIAQPVTIPVYDISIKDNAEVRERPVDYVYRSRNNVSSIEDVRGYLIHSDSLAPVIEKGDVIVVVDAGEENKRMEAGDYVACRSDDGLYIGKMEVRENKKWLVSPEVKIELKDCSNPVVIIEVIKRLKRL